MTPYKTISEIEEPGLSESDREHEILHWLFDTGDGVIAAIHDICFNRKTVPEKYKERAHETLGRHNLIGFDVCPEDEYYE